MRGNKKKYDLIFSLGGACSCTMSLRAAGLQLASFPFDWVLNPNIEKRAKILASRFDNWMERSDLEFLYDRRSPHPCHVYSNKRTSVDYLHDFPLEQTLDESFRTVKDRYQRRIRRLLNLIDNSNSVLAVYLDPPNQGSTKIEEVISARNIIAAAFPRQMIDLLYFRMSESNIVKESSPSKNIIVIELDYKDHEDWTDPWDIDNKLIAEILASRFAVSDYRTREEKAIYKYKQRVKKFARVNANNIFSYTIKRFGQNLTHFIRKRLDSK